MSTTPVAGSTTVLRTEPVDASPPGGAGATRRDRERTRLGTSQLLLGMALLLAWVLVYLTVLSGFEQSRAQHALYQQLRTELAAGTAPTAAPIGTGEPVALLSIPDADVEGLVVIEGSRPTQLQDGPGHVLGSVLPGQRGTSTVAGRSLSFGAPFKRIGELDRGDAVEVVTAQGEFTYRVVGARRDGDPIPAEVATAPAVLRLLSSDRGRLSASETIYVDAVLTGDPASAGARAGDDADARHMEAGTDITTLALLALALQLFVGALAAFSWAWNRWSRRGAWIAVTPCVVAAAWLVSSVGTRLLPGLV